MENLVQAMTQFGVAGLMGALWVWERAMSRQREAQLNAAHRRLLAQRQSLRVLVGTVRRNTAAIERFEQTQRRVCELLERIHDENQRAA